MEDMHVYFSRLVGIFLHKSLLPPPHKISIFIVLFASDAANDQADEVVADLDQGDNAEAHAEPHDAPDIGDGVDDGGVLVNLNPCGERFPDEHRQHGSVVLGVFCQSCLKFLKIKFVKLVDFLHGPDFVLSTEKVVLPQVLNLLAKPGIPPL